MKNALIVIGSSWGDEGKGHITDLLCSKKENTLNVRFNGGAQASHTVTTPNGERHAFSHFGSGTFVNAPTYLTEDFMINIFRFELERYKLKESFGITPKIYVNSRCNITTLWDMYINQAIESIRGDKRHGSCGMGINETVHRSKYDEYRLTVMDLLDISTLREKLEKIQNEYVPLRLKNKYNLTIEELPKEYQNMLRDFENINMTIFYASEFVKHCNIVDDYILKRFDTVVFEGAQGLLLDQGYKKFWPNVTTSNTGIQNVMKLLKRINYKGKLQIFYVSRCYATRHGRGEFPTEVNGKPYKKIVDLTNIPNEFQESLRFGLLDLDLLIESISEDLKKLIFPAKVCMFFTCFDQLDDYAKYVYENTEKNVSKKTFLSEISSIITKNIAEITEVFATNGETRNDVIKCTF